MTSSLLASLCWVCVYGVLPAVLATAGSLETTCGREGRYCEVSQLEDEFVALQIGQVLSPGSDRFHNDAWQGAEARLRLFSAKGYTGVKLVDAGLSRTGTESIEQALVRLGYTPSHGERFKNPGTPEAKAMHKALFQHHPGDVLKYLESWKVDTVMDAPLNYLLEPIQQHWDAKVILSLHPHGATGWVNSIIKFVRWWPLDSAYPVPKEMPWLLGCRTPVSPTATLTAAMRQICMDAYEKYTQHVISVVPKDRLLVYNVTTGWEPLCKFLAKPVPNDYGVEPPFPWIDNVAQKKRDLRSVGCSGPIGCIDVVNGHPPEPSDRSLIPKDDWQNL